MEENGYSDGVDIDYLYEQMRDAKVQEMVDRLEIDLKLLGISK